MVVMKPTSIPIVWVCKSGDRVREMVTRNSLFFDLRAEHGLKIHEDFPYSPFKMLFFLVPLRPIPVRGRILRCGANTVARERRSNRVDVCPFPFHASVSCCFPLQAHSGLFCCSLPLGRPRRCEARRSYEHQFQFEARDPLPLLILHSQVFEETIARCARLDASVLIGRDSRLLRLAHVVFCFLIDLRELLANAIDQGVH